MKKTIVVSLFNRFLFVSLAVCAHSESFEWLPEAVTNNAVAYVQIDNSEYLASFGGVGVGKTRAEIHAKVWVYRFADKTWRSAGEVPNGEGRLASVAATVANQIYLFGGYTVTEDGTETSLSYVHEFDPRDAAFTSRQPMPVAVDDTVALTYQDRYVYLVSGWHDLGNVNLVQRYDTKTDTWDQATPFPGAPVFGHAGAIIAGQLLICGGSKIVVRKDAQREFVLSKVCFRGEIDNQDGRWINWHPVKDPYGASRYRAVGVASGKRILFVGGTDRPYNYDGIGYDGKASQPIGEIVAFDLESSRWLRAGVLPHPSMDHRGTFMKDDNIWLIGGMLEGQKVTPQVRIISVDE